MKYLELREGIYTQVDDEDFVRFSGRKWSLHSKGYAHSVDSYLHRLIVNAKPGQQVDHINGDKLDNRRSNLRLCTNSQNQRNRPKARELSSKYKGVHWTESNKSCPWSTQITVNKKTTHIGHFKKQEQAALAYDLWAVYLSGEYARTNFKVVAGS